jgi:hypothetical protein
MALLQTFQRNMPPYSGYLQNFDNTAHFRTVSTFQHRKLDVPPKCQEYKQQSRGANVRTEEQPVYTKCWEISFHMVRHLQTYAVSTINVHESSEPVTTSDTELKLPFLLDLYLAYTYGSCIPIR